MLEGVHTWGIVSVEKGGKLLALSGIVEEGLVANLVGVHINYPNFLVSKL